MPINNTDSDLYFNFRMNYDRNGRERRHNRDKERRQASSPPPDNERRQGNERRHPEPCQPCSQQRQALTGQNASQNPLSTLLQTCCNTVNDHGLSVTVTVKVSRKKD